MTEPLVVVDADVLGRRRTGDETYVRNLLRELGSLADASGFRIAAVTRHPELVPDGIEPLVLRTPLQELRMLRTLPRLLRRTGAALVHTQYAVPVRSPCPAVVTIHDLSFEHGSEHMALKDRLVFRRVVPRAARAARRVLTVSERTRADLVRLYGLPEEKVVVTPNGVDPGVCAREQLCSSARTSSRSGRCSRGRTTWPHSPPPRLSRCRSSSPAPSRTRRSRRRLRDAGADLRGYVSQEELAELYRGAACLVQPSHFEGFGLPMLEAMASGTPVVALDEPALREVGGDAAIFVEEDAPRRRHAPRARRARRAGRGGARAGAGVQLARDRGADARGLPGGARVTVSAVVVSHGHARELEESLPALAPQVDELVVIANLPGSVGSASAWGARAREPAAAHVRGERQRRRRGNDRRLRPRLQSGRGARAGRGRSARAASPTHTRAPASSARSSSGRTAPGSRRSAASRTCSARSGAERRSGSCVAPTSTRPLTTARARPSRSQGDWLLGGACLLMRRSMLEEIGGWDGGFRHYVEDIDVAYRAAQAGWERWLVPEAIVHHAYAAVIDKRFLSRHTLWHLRGMARFVRKHPERLLVLR